ncbi:Rieske (2Fe-2S) protein [Allokutzneria albata]|uniref:Ferredoxin subunit of nitrite reductase or a ring-hydroxylating dioxygenase n=1 Tax=Allokutzneria albata TaxID=211114 RepID=A0A1G9VGV5_ALLAB|nr:Rieske (2Fe-2S) protein [Allokutzneria albata]SDM71346.1 Ferredoxin subunit of nitrite reductase or a ring-hydroxylating dioxygenase [Allokutzneria albata]
MPTTRRNVLAATGLALPCVLAACGGQPTQQPQPSSSSAPQQQPTTGPLAALADVPVGGGKLVDAGGRKVLLVRTSETEVKGYDPTCPHAGATVQPPTGSTIKCPLHGSTFDTASGSVTGGPAKSGLKTVAVKVEKDQVVLA